MKKIISALLPLLLFAVTVSAQEEKPEGLFINSKAPDFKATDQNGKEVSLKELKKKGPVVIVFYRGYWCPYCSKFLKKLQDSLQLITDKKASIVAITPEAKEGIDSTVQKTGASFPIIYDEDMKIAKNYGVFYRVDDRTVTRYQTQGIELLKTNHQTEAALPVPAIYVVNKEGSVIFRYFDVDYRKRIPVRELVKAIY
jgi:peroxiredoxin